jgi:glycosyltransferase involved in cell wall biosynthesis
LGSGMQNKILEAMAMELPCVTSQLANNAIKGKSGANVLVAGSDNEYVKHILFLLNNGHEALRIGQAARAFVKEEYTWKKVNGLLIQAG